MDINTVCETVMGKTLEEASQVIKGAGFRPRVRSVDGELRIGTADFRRDRINLYLDGGIVSKTTVG